MIGLVSFAHNHFKIIVRFVLIFAVLFLYDTVLDLLLTLLHSLFVVVHITFEFCEHWLDVLIEYLFHTSPRSTEIIVFYIMASIISIIAFKIITALPDFYCQSSERLRNYWYQQKIKATSTWQNQSLKEKVKWGSFFITSSIVLGMLALS